MAKSKQQDRRADQDAWERFERAVDAAVKSGPKHRKNPATAHYLVIDGKMRVAGRFQKNADGSITTDVYRNLKDCDSGRVMERAFTFWP